MRGLVPLAQPNPAPAPTSNLNPAPVAPTDQLAQLGSDLIAWVKWGGLVLGVIGLMVCGLMMIMGRRSHRSHLAAEGASGLAWVIGGLALIPLASGIVAAFLA